jgi:tetratricopeptide (TPR) repeat protein
MAPVIGEMRNLWLWFLNLLGWTSIWIFLLVTLTNVNLPMESGDPLRQISGYLFTLKDFNLITTEILNSQNNPVVTALVGNQTYLALIPVLVLVILLFFYLHHPLKNRVHGLTVLCFSLILFTMTASLNKSRWHPEISKYCGDHFFRRGRLSLAKNEYLKAFQNDLDPEKLYLLGEIHRQQGMQDIALRYYYLAIKENNEYFAPYYRIGILELNKQNYEVASEYLNRAARLNPGVPEIYSNSGIAYIGLNNLTSAENMFREAVRIKPGYAQGWYNLGNLYFQYLHSPESIRYFERCLAINPDFEPAIQQLRQARLVFQHDSRTESNLPKQQPGKANDIE